MVEVGRGERERERERKIERQKETERHRHNTYNTHTHAQRTRTRTRKHKYTHAPAGMASWLRRMKENARKTPLSHSCRTQAPRPLPRKRSPHGRTNLPMCCTSRATNSTRGCRAKRAHLSCSTHPCVCAAQSGMACLPPCGCLSACLCARPRHLPRPSLQQSTFTPPSHLIPCTLVCFRP